MSHRKKIVLKITGNLIAHSARGLDASALRKIAQQVKKLQASHLFGIVVGGGNFFRGDQNSPEVAISAQTGHTVGMLATMMNGLIVQDIFEQEGIATTLFTALACDAVGAPLSPQAVREALTNNRCLIFSGGTGAPFFSTDTTAVVRALQMQATELWKGTKVDGVYSADPATDSSAQRLAHLTYNEALDKDLRIMDAAAFALAKPHNLVIRVFNLFTDNALIKAADNADFGSTIAQS